MADLTATELASFIENEVREAVNRQAYIVAQRYPGIETEDVQQEIWLWAYGPGKRKAFRLFLSGNIKMVERALYNAAVDYCEREKRATQGYDWRDDYTYTRPEVARLLPLALDPATIPGLSGGGLHDGPSAKSDPAYGGGMLASIMDVRTAFGKLSQPDQQYLVQAVAYDNDWAQIAAFSGLTEKSAYAKYMRILDRMVTRHLGRRTDDD